MNENDVEKALDEADAFAESEKNRYYTKKEVFVKLWEKLENVENKQITEK